MLQICDFGLAKWKQHAATQTTTKIRRGTIAYMAPEVHRDPGVSRTTKYDVYSFGILLWALLSEKTPYENGTNIMHLMKIDFSNVHSQKALNPKALIMNMPLVTFYFKTIILQKKLYGHICRCILVKGM